MKDEKKFITRSIIFVIPILIVIGFAFSILYAAGEFSDTTTIVERQMAEEDVVYGLAYSGEKPYKLQSILIRKPKLITLGTSRMLSFSSVFFNNDFYNGGRAVGRLHDFRVFLSAIPRTAQPETILLGLDHNFFSDKTPVVNAEEIRKEYTAQPNSFVLFNNLRTIYADWFKGKYSIKQIFKHDPNTIGMTAITKGDGFRNDGTYVYNYFITNGGLDNPEYWDYQFKETLARVEQGRDGFEHGGISRDALKELMLFLRDCSERNIEVIGVMPPFTHTVYEKMAENRENFDYVFTLYPAMKAIFDEYDYALYDFSDLAWTGASDAEAIDGFHGSEKAYLRMTLIMADDLEAYVDKAKLKNLLERTKGSLYVSDLPE